jgi:hypothetical protein
LRIGNVLLFTIYQILIHFDFQRTKFRFNFFFQDYTPTGFDKVLAELEVDKHKVQFILWDTSGKYLSSSYAVV